MSVAREPFRTGLARDSYRFCKPTAVAPHLLPCKNIFSLPGIRRPAPTAVLKIDLEHDACHMQKSHKRQAAEEIPMYQRGLPVRHPHIALSQTLAAHEPLKARKLFRAFIDHSLRVLRLLGEFFAAGGALS